MRFEQRSIQGPSETAFTFDVMTNLNTREKNVVSVQHNILNFILINQYKRNCSSLFSISIFPIDFFQYAIKHLGFRIKTFEKKLVFDVSKAKHRYGSNFLKPTLKKKNAL